MSSTSMLLWQQGAALAGIAGAIELVPFAAVTSRALGAVADTVVGHGALGCVAWWLATGAASQSIAPPSTSVWGRGGALGPSSLLMAAACGVLSIALDLDHFLSARSLSLGAALSLPARPFGHAATFVFSTCVCTRIASAISHGVVPPWAWVWVACAWGTHLWRDALKRGVWLWPLGTTAPVPLYAYLLVLAAVPTLVRVAVRSYEGTAAPLLPV